MSFAGPQAYAYAVARPFSFTDDDGLYPDGYPDPNQAADVASVADVLDTEGMRCLARCIEETDPLGASADAVGATLLPIPKTWMPAFGVREIVLEGSEPLTNLFSIVSARLQLGARSWLRNLGRSAIRRVGGAVMIGHGLTLVGVEGACVAQCRGEDTCHE